MEDLYEVHVSEVVVRGTALARTWMNGWCTDRRFQRRNSRCVLCSSCTGEDSIEHYLACPVVWDVAVKNLRFAEPRCLAWKLLLLNGGHHDDDSVALSAALVYATYIATNKLRHQPSRAVHNQGRDAIVNAIRSAGLQSRPLRRILHKIWAK